MKFASLVLSVGLLLLVPTPGLAQSTSTLCVTVTGTSPSTGWDATSLETAVKDGSVIISVVDDAATCAAPAASLEPAADQPLPVEVVETGFALEGSDLHWVALVRNPNPSRWVATYMAAQVSALDGDGGLVDSDDDNVTILPGQVTAIVGTISDAKGVKTIEVQLANAESDWQELDGAAGDLIFDQVKVKPGDYSTSVNGRATSSFIEQQESVEVYSVYRKGGKLIGGDYTYLDFVPAGGSAVFKILSDFDKLPKGVNVEIYYQL